MIAKSSDKTRPLGYESQGPRVQLGGSFALQTFPVLEQVLPGTGGPGISGTQGLLCRSSWPPNHCVFAFGQDCPQLSTLG